MPSSHPIPTIAALALSLYASDRRVEKLPTVTEYTPRRSQWVDLNGSYAGAFGAASRSYETLTIWGDL